MDSEAGVFSITFDMSGTRMITTEADKTIKVYREDDTAVSNHLKNYLKGVYLRRKNSFYFLISVRGVASNQLETWHYQEKEVLNYNEFNEF